MSVARIALVTTVSGEAASLAEFVRHHLGAGFERIFLFFDDPDDRSLGVVPDDERIAVAVHDDDLRACWADWTELRSVAQHDLAARRMLNAELAVQLCRNDDLSWLVQLAPDELIGAAGAAIGDVLAGLPDDVGQIMLPCIAAIPESDCVVHPFAELTLFKRPRAAVGVVTLDHARALAAAGRTAASWFGQPERVRSAVRIAPGILPTDTFTFNLGTSARHTIAVTEPRVLCYGDGSFAAFARHNATWGPLASTLFGHVPLDQHRIDTLLAPRQAVASGPEAAARYYCERVAVPDRSVCAALIAAGLCERIEPPGARRDGERE